MVMYDFNKNWGLETLNKSVYIKNQNIFLKS